MAEEIIKGYWERKVGFLSEHQIDARWVLRMPDDDKAHGSLRIVSHPDLPPGHLKAFASFVTSRRPKTEEEIIKSVVDFQMDEQDLELYSVDEYIVTQDMPVYIATKQELEKTYGVKIFGK